MRDYYKDWYRKAYMQLCVTNQNGGDLKALIADLEAVEKHKPHVDSEYIGNYSPDTLKEIESLIEKVSVFK
jgi:hypothetical protein